MPCCSDLWVLINAFRFWGLNCVIIWVWRFLTMSWLTSISEAAIHCFRRLPLMWNIHEKRAVRGVAILEEADWNMKYQMFHLHFNCWDYWCVLGSIRHETEVVSGCRGVKIKITYIKQQIPVWTKEKDTNSPNYVAPFRQYSDDKWKTSQLFWIYF